MGIDLSVEELVLKRALQAAAAGCDGVIASGLEAAPLRTALGPRPLIVTPGIRPADGARNRRPTARRHADARVPLGRRPHRRRQAHSRRCRSVSSRHGNSRRDCRRVWMNGGAAVAPAPDPGLARRLRRMRAIATALLIAMAVVYVVTTWFVSPNPYVEAARAFAEAALVGGLADWFAVTALFRRPSGPADPAHRDRAGAQEPDRPRVGAFHPRSFSRSRGRRAPVEPRQSGGAARRLARGQPQRGAREPRSRRRARVGVARGRQRRRAARRARQHLARSLRRGSRQSRRGHRARGPDDRRTGRSHHRSARRVRPQRARAAARVDSRADPRAKPMVVAEVRRPGDLRQARRRARGAARCDRRRPGTPGAPRDQVAPRIAAACDGRRPGTRGQEPRAQGGARRAPRRAQLRVRALAALAKRARNRAGGRGFAARARACSARSARSARGCDPTPR